jgi:dTDP-4-amino-4,6-dideoxygalactose transaminase
MMINFNRAYSSGLEISNISLAISSRRLSGDGPFTMQATSLLNTIHNSLNSKILLTTSCTDALEMSAILLNVMPGDEVIMPSYTFVSTALAFEMRGANIVFADSNIDSPHIDSSHVTKLITPKTKAIIPVHYAGIACDMNSLLSNNISIVEDNAQGITSTLNGKALGTIGCIGTLSFHESKNINCGEGGAIIINDPNLAARAEVIREKGTNRSSFFRGEVNKYGWCDIGSSYLPSDILAAFLCAQLDNIIYIQSKRHAIFSKYLTELSYTKGYGWQLPIVPEDSTSNAHIFYIVMNSLEERSNFIKYMKKNNIHSVFHYLSLHKSEYFRDKYSGDELKNSDRYSDCLVRLPLYPDLTEEQVNYIIKVIKNWNGK